MFIAINTHQLIAQPVNALARFMTTTNSEHYMLAKGVLRYLKGVKSRKIVWCAARVKFSFVPCEIYAYSDASWADVVPQHKSSLSYLIFCNNAVFSWKFSLSSVLAMSSAEAELIALCLVLPTSLIAVSWRMSWVFCNCPRLSFTRIISVLNSWQNQEVSKEPQSISSYDGNFCIIMSTGASSASRPSNATFNSPMLVPPLVVSLKCKAWVP